MAANGLTIDRLHVRANGGHAPGAANPAGLHVALEQTLRLVRPSPLPPQAILVIRTLACRVAFGADGGAQLRWRQQLEGQLADLARQALRPDRQYVPPQANSVLFDEEATLLECLTRDVLAGRWTWYWDKLFPAAAMAARLGLGSRAARSRGGCLLTAWLAYPQAVPYALVGLRPTAAAAALNLLGPADLAQLAHSLHATFALPRGALDAAGSAPGSLEPTVEPMAAPAPGAPWQEWLPSNHMRDLAPPAEYLLGLCYILAHRPQAARGQEFGLRARRWLEDTMVAHAAGRRRIAAGPDKTDAIGPLGLVKAQIDLAAPQGEPAVRGLTATWPAGDAAVQAPGAAEPRSAGQSGAAQSPMTLGAGAFTRLGGAIFFVNVMILLGLPESIPALARLNPWALVGAFAASSSGCRFPEFAADPLWAAVDELGGEETLRPWGSSLLPGAEFRMPPAWCDLLPAQDLVAYREPAGGRLQIWAVEPGYLLADLPSDASLAAARAEWPALAAISTRPAGMDDLPAGTSQLLAPALAWWVQRLQPFVVRFLARLTGQGGDAAAALFRRPGTLYASRTHVDLVLPVEQISIPLRRAGLDRTPGWRPEFGYIITIHFE